jgi:hypothetical protein
MTIKFQRAPNLKPPPVCRKAPPWPAPTRLPRGFLTASYQYELTDDEGHTIKNVGTLRLSPTGENYWEFVPADPIYGRVTVNFWYWEEPQTCRIDLNIVWTETIGSYWFLDDIPVPTNPPFAIDEILIFIEDPHWLWATCRVSIRGS